MRIAAVFITSGLLSVALLGCGETDESYCHGIYDGNQAVTTPMWAVKDHLFDDYASCVEWYDDAAQDDRNQGGP